MGNMQNTINVILTSSFKKSQVTLFGLINNTDMKVHAVMGVGRHRYKSTK